ncbi:MAG: hypothetical protein J5507_03065 [Clostridia bacterium]|nr:hypothetical protein [Clostridia bacterium]
MKLKNIIKFILFLIYVIGIFFINNYFILGAITIFNIVLILIAKINIKKTVINLIKLLPFILFTSAINLIFINLQSAILITIRLILVCNISYIFSKTITYLEFADVIEKLFYPLRIFKINPKEISLIVTIAISFMPIMKDELLQMKNVLKVKGINSTKINLIKNINLIFKPFFISVLQRVNEIELSLKAKGYLF